MKHLRVLLIAIWALLLLAIGTNSFGQQTNYTNGSNPKDTLRVKNNFTADSTVKSNAIFANILKVGGVSLYQVDSSKVVKYTDTATGKPIATKSYVAGQIPTALPPNGSAGGDLTGTYPNPTINAGAINNSKIASGAAISYSKLNLAGSITNSDISNTAAIPYSKLNLTGSINVADHSATGTPSSTTFLRGDNTWAVPSGGGGGTSSIIGRRTYVLSQLGFLSDADLSFYPSTFGTDQTTHMQQILDSQQVYGAIDIWVDVKISVGRLVYGPHTHFYGYNGGGFVKRTNTAGPLLVNKDTVFGHTTIDSDVVFENLILNGNGFNSSGTRTNATADTVYGVHGNIAAYGVTNLLIDHCTILNSPVYAIAANTVIYGTISNNYIENSNYATVNTDGGHLDGASKHCRITNNVIKHCNDDAIAINGADIYYKGSGSASGSYYPLSANGRPEDITIDHNVLDSNNTYGIRLFTYGVGGFGSIYINDNRGSTTNYAILIDGNYNSTYSGGSFGDIVIENNKVRVKSYTSDSVGDIFVRGNVENLIIKSDIVKNEYDGGQLVQTPAIRFYSPVFNKITIGNFTLSGFNFYDTSNTLTTSPIFFGKNIYLKNVVLNDIIGNRIRDTFFTAQKQNSALFTCSTGDTIENITWANSIASGYGFAARVGGYINKFLINGLHVKKNAPSPYGAINGDGGYINQLIVSNTTVDSGGNIYYAGATGVCNSKSGDYFSSSTYLNKAKGNDTVIGKMSVTNNLTVGGLVLNKKFTSSNYTKPDSVSIALCAGPITVTEGSTTDGHLSIIVGNSGVTTASPGAITINSGQSLTRYYDGNTSSWKVLSFYPGFLLPVQNSGTDPTNASIPGCTDMKGLAFKRVYKLNPSYTPDSSDNLIQVDGTGTITLPTSGGIKVGQTYRIEHYGASTGTVTVSSISPFNVALTNYNAITLGWDGSVWKVLNSYAIASHVTNNQPTPTVVLGTGAGTGATYTITGDDKSGTINLVTGSSPTLSAVVATITFNGTFTNAPRVTLTPVSLLSAQLSGATAPFVPCAGQTNGVTATTFTILANTTALPASSNLVYSYTIN